MAVIVDSFGRNRYEITLSVPESQWVSNMAEFLGMAHEAVVAASFGHGIMYYTAMCEGLRRQSNERTQETKIDG